MRFGVQLRGATMGQYHYLSKRYDRSFYSFQTRFCVPRSLQNHFGRKTFKISLKSVSYGDSKKLSYRLHGLVQAVFEEIKMGKKKLTLDEVKSILKIEVDKSVLHIQHIETGTGTTENQVYQSLQHITQEETRFQRRLEDERKKVEDSVNREMSKILQSNGFKIDKKSLEFKTLRKRVIELKLLRYSHKKDFVSGKDTELNGFIEECDRKFNLGILDKKVEEPKTITKVATPTFEVRNEVEEAEETLWISNLIKEYIEETERQKGLREKTIVEYKNTLEMMVEIIGDFPIHELSQKHGRLLSSTL